MGPETELYNKIIEYVDVETVFTEKNEIPEVDIESTCFVSYEKGYVLQVRPEIDDVALEYGLGLANSETESGLNYIRTVDSRDEIFVNSLEDAREFLTGINPRINPSSD